MNFFSLANLVAFIFALGAGLSTTASADNGPNYTSLPISSIQIGDKSTKVLISINEITALVQASGLAGKTYTLNAYLQNSGNTTLFVNLAESSHKKAQDPNFGCQNISDQSSLSQGKICTLEVLHQIGKESDPAPPEIVPAPTSFAFWFDTGRVSQQPAGDSGPAPQAP